MKIWKRKTVLQHAIATASTSEKERKKLDKVTFVVIWNPQLIWRLMKNKSEDVISKDLWSLGSCRGWCRDIFFLKFSVKLNRLRNIVNMSFSKFTSEMKCGWLHLSTWFARYSFEKFVHLVHRTCVSIHQAIVYSITNFWGDCVRFFRPSLKHC